MIRQADGCVFDAVAALAPWHRAATSQFAACVSLSFQATIELLLLLLLLCSVGFSFVHPLHAQPLQVRAYQDPSQSPPAQQPGQPAQPADLLLLNALETRITAAISDLKQDFKQEFSDLKQDLKHLKQDFKQDFSDLKQDLKEDIKEVKEDLKDVKKALLEVSSKKDLSDVKQDLSEVKKEQLKQTYALFGLVALIVLVFGWKDLLPLFVKAL